MLHGNECSMGRMWPLTAGSAGIVRGYAGNAGTLSNSLMKSIYGHYLTQVPLGYMRHAKCTCCSAVGGCQAEVGVASAMAASAAVELTGEVHRKNVLLRHATVLMNHAWVLVCDPGRRSGRISMSEQKCCRCGKRHNCRRNGSRRNSRS